MRKVVFAADSEGSPAGIGNPMMLFRESVGQERIPNRLWKWDVDDATEMEMSNLRLIEPEFDAPESMGMSRGVGPRQHFIFYRL